MKRRFAVSILVVCVTLLASSGVVFGTGGQESTEAADMAAEKMTVNIASTYPPNSPQDMGLNKFKELVEQRSGGRIEVLIHASGAMGDERQTFEMLSNGSVEYGAVGTNDIATWYPRYAVAEVPYVFASVDQFWKFWEGPGKQISQMIEHDKGVRTVGVILRGARYLTANRPIRTVDDVKGLKMRLPPVKSWFKVWEHLGALPTNVAFSEVYMALKTGTVEAQENPPETILNYKFYEAQKYLIATKHIFSAARIQMSMKWFNALNKSDQDLLIEAMDESVTYANELTRDGDEKFVKQLQEKGMTLIEVDLNEFAKAVQPVLEQMAKEDFDPTFFDKLKNLM